MARTSSPKRVKSAERMEGAMRMGEAEAVKDTASPLEILRGSQIFLNNSAIKEPKQISSWAQLRRWN